MTWAWEPTGGLLRRLLPGEPVGGVYDRLVAIVGDEGAATLKGLLGEVSTGDRKEISDALCAAGFTSMRWWRHRPDGSRVPRIVAVRPSAPIDAPGDMIR